MEAFAILKQMKKAIEERDNKMLKNCMQEMDDDVESKIGRVMENSMVENAKGGQFEDEDMQKLLERPKIIFSFRSDILGEVEAVCKALAELEIDACGINDQENFRLQWFSNAKRAAIGIAMQYDRDSYVCSLSIVV
jgi:hypothetical protein